MKVHGCQGESTQAQSIKSMTLQCALEHIQTLINYNIYYWKQPNNLIVFSYHRWIFNIYTVQCMTYNA